MQTEHTLGLATSLFSLNGTISVVVTNRDGISRNTELNSMSEGGIPNPIDGKTAVIHRLFTDMHSWTLVPPDEYLNALGYASQILPYFLHEIYSFTDDGRIYVVPALVLIQAFMLPQSGAFKESYRHNFLERVVQITVDKDNEFSLRVWGDGKWNCRAEAPPYIKYLYGWFSSYPSGNRLANSIHKNARKGYFGVELPRVQADVIVSGTEIGGVTYINKLRICRLVPSEPSTFHIKGQTDDICITNAAKDRRITTGRATLKYSIPISENGATDVTNDEWEKIRSIVQIRHFNMTRCKHDQRDIFNAILRKLHSGEKWRTCNFGPIDWANAAVRFHRWHRTGRFQVMIDALKSIRRH